MGHELGAVVVAEDVVEGGVTPEDEAGRFGIDRWCAALSSHPGNRGADSRGQRGLGAGDLGKRRAGGRCGR